MYSAKQLARMQKILRKHKITDPLPRVNLFSPDDVHKLRLAAAQEEVFEKEQELEEAQYDAAMYEARALDAEEELAIHEARELARSMEDTLRRSADEARILARAMEAEDTARQLARELEALHGQKRDLERISKEYLEMVSREAQKKIEIQNRLIEVEKELHAKEEKWQVG